MDLSNYTVIGTINAGAIQVLSCDWSHEVCIQLQSGEVIGYGEEFPRFYVEQEPIGWIVYDLETNTAYRMDG